MLVANDNEFQLFVISNSLINLQYVDKIDTASNGQEALELVIKNEKEYLTTGKFTYDLIFLDLDMPIKDGFQACEDILNFYQSLRREGAHVINSSSLNWIDDF
jgi:CheY-like chemotaxis protein